MNESTTSIFRKYYEESPFLDRYVDGANQAVDVIIPVIHTNELWRTNLLSYYREIPVHRLLIGDGGCVDDSIEIAKEFPRVEVLDHRSFTSLGYSLRKLIESVQTEWFVYLHSDVYLPSNWFEEMSKRRAEFDWFECPQRITALVEYDVEDSGRALSGAQMGRARVLREVVTKVEDDFLYRNEDIILAGLIKDMGYVYGNADNTYHFHQAMYKQSAWIRKIKSVRYELEMSREERLRASLMQVKGLIKYLAPDEHLVKSVAANMRHLLELKEMSWTELIRWANEVNPIWVPLLSKEAKKYRWRGIMSAVVRKIKNG